MRKFIVILTAILIIVALIGLILHDRFNEEKILNIIKERTGLNFELQAKNVWDFYPQLNYINPNVNITKNNSSLNIQNAEIQITKSYWPLSPVLIYLKSSFINYEGMEMRNALLKAKYINSILHIENLNGNIVEGTINIEGKVDFDNNHPFVFQGQFKNISLNTLLKQSQVASWDRVNIKLTSSNFKISSKGNDDQDMMTSLIGTIPITGSIYFTSTDEERFGAAFLSLLVEKIPSLTSISKSVDFLLSTYANVPSSFNGILMLKDGSISSKEILIKNKNGKSTLNGSYNFIEDTINGKIYFYEKNEIFLEASLHGPIENPKILVAGKVFSDQEERPMQDIKQLLEKGINSFIEKILSKNE